VARSLLQLEPFDPADRGAAPSPSQCTNDFYVTN
jgi:hypothetical protein